MRPNKNCDPVKREKQWDFKAVVLHDQIKIKNLSILFYFNGAAAFSETG